jgi:uncharacterized protein (DUF1684 family)
VTFQDYLDLVDWRRRVGDHFRIEGADALSRFRAARNQLFGTHPQSPIPAAERASFKGLSYFPGDPGYRLECDLRPSADESELEIDTGGDDGVLVYRRAGEVHFQLGGEECRLTVFALRSYGGGLFLPFRDATSGRESYGGGRYLFDTAKNTDGLSLLCEAGSARITIDFNYAYNASCAYNPRWACPLAPPENWLAAPVQAGELKYHP